MSFAPYGASAPKFDLSGDTHSVLGHDIPVGMDEGMLTELGKLPLEDDMGERVDALAPEAVAKFVAYATGHNNACAEDETVSAEALVMALAADRLIRWWGIDDAESEVLAITSKMESRWTLPCRKRRLGEELGTIKERLASPEDNWSLWRVSSGEWLELVPIRTWEGEDANVINETVYYALTDDGNAAYGTPDGIFPMWEIMRLMETADLYECDELLARETLKRLRQKKLAYDLLDTPRSD